MSQLGFGVMIGMLMGGDRGAQKLQASIGKKITALTLSDECRESSLTMEFEDGTSLKIRDDGQSCCEQRFMSTDDDLSTYIGAELRDVTLEDGPTVDNGDYEVREEQFLRVYTSNGVFTVVTHNNHNGYYGGFLIVIE